jgi:RpiR family glv operon transcriptional regulator
MISLATIINNNKSLLTKSDQVICEFLLEKQQLIPQMTLLDLAQETYSSKSNVLRLLKKIGFSGFTDFRYYLLALGNNNNGNASLINISERIGSFNLENITPHFSELISQADNIYLFATGQDQQIQAKNLANYLLKIGVISTFVPLNTNAELTNNIISSIKQTDLIIIFSSKGNNETLKSYFKDFSKEKFHIITFTAFKNGWIQEKAEIPISLEIQQFQDSILPYQSGMMHLLLNFLVSTLDIQSSKIWT